MQRKKVGEKEERERERERERESTVMENEVFVRLEEAQREKEGKFLGAHERGE